MNIDNTTHELKKYLVQYYDLPSDVKLDEQLIDKGHINSVSLKYALKSLQEKENIDLSNIIVKIHKYQSINKIAKYIDTMKKIRNYKNSTINEIKQFIKHEIDTITNKTNLIKDDTNLKDILSKNDFEKLTDKIKNTFKINITESTIIGITNSIINKSKSTKKKNTKYVGMLTGQENKKEMASKGVAAVFLIISMMLFTNLPFFDNIAQNLVVSSGYGTNFVMYNGQKYDINEDIVPQIMNNKDSKALLFLESEPKNLSIKLDKISKSSNIKVGGTSVYEVVNQYFEQKYFEEQTTIQLPNNFNYEIPKDAILDSITAEFSGIDNNLDLNDVTVTKVDEYTSELSFSVTNPDLFSAIVEIKFPKENIIDKGLNLITGNLIGQEEPLRTFTSAFSGFTFQIQTTSTPQTFSFQADNAINLQIDWGDDVNQTNTTTGLIAHEYATPGIYNVTLLGYANRISFGEGTPNLLIDILTNISDGLTGINSSRKMFKNANLITTFSNDYWLDKISGNITDMSEMFQGATNFNSNISSWNTSNVINMREMFENADAFNQDISGWDTSQVTSMEDMFNLASNFNQNLGSWNISSLISNFIFALDYTDLSTQNYDGILNGWASQSPNIKDGDTLFARNATYCNSEDARNFLITNHSWSIVDGGKNCGYPNGFTFQLNITTNSQVIKFEVDNAINLDVYWNDNINETYTTTGEIEHTYAQPGIYNVTLNGYANKIGFYPTRSYLIDILTNMSLGLTGINSTYEMFRDADKIINFSEENWFDDISKNVINMSRMFLYADNFNQDVSTWNTSKVKDMSYMFQGAKKFNKSLDNWDTSNVENMRNMFYFTEDFNQNLNTWDTKNVITMESMFERSSFNNNLSNWNISKVTNMIDMFTDNTLSKENYDALLNGWSSQSPNIQNNIVFDAGSSKFCLAGENITNTLIGIHNWTINDLNLDSSCITESFTTENCNNATDCQSKVKNNALININSDFQYNGTSVFDINWVGNLIIDCNGHTITSTRNKSLSGHSYFVNAVNGTLGNITVRKCILDNFEYDISISNTDILNISNIYSIYESDSQFSPRYIISSSSNDFNINNITSINKSIYVNGDNGHIKNIKGDFISTGSSTYLLFNNSNISTISMYSGNNNTYQNIITTDIFNQFSCNNHFENIQINGIEANYYMDLGVYDVCPNTFKNVTLNGGFIKYYGTSQEPCPTQPVKLGDNYSQIVLHYCNNTIFENGTLNNKIFIKGSINNTFNNINITGFRASIYLGESNHNKFNNITISGTHELVKIEERAGIYGSRSNTNTFTNISIDTKEDGVDGWDINHNQFINININNVSINGMEIDSSYNISVVNAIINNSGIDGYDVHWGDYHSLSNVTIINSKEKGIEIYNAEYFTIKDCTIKDNSEGIHLQTWSSLYTRYTNIYNNFFNNTNNIVFEDGSNLPNYFNTILNYSTDTTYTTNIINGFIQGGNYWANPDGTGHSQTCLDYRYPFGICDEKLKITSYSDRNIDYYPLTTPINLSTCDITNNTNQLIDTTMYCEHQSFNLTSLNITGKLILHNVTLNTINIDAAGDFILSNSNILLKENFTTNGVFYSYNSTIVFNQITDDENGITINPTSNTIIEYTNITSVNVTSRNFSYNFIVRRGSNFSMDNSFVSGTGSTNTDRHRGLEINTTVTSFNNNYLHSRITSLTIYSNSNIIENNILDGPMYPLMIYGDNNSIYNNTKLNVGYSIWIHGDHNNITQFYSANHTGGLSLSGNYNHVKDIKLNGILSYVSGTNNILDNLTIINLSFEIHNTSINTTIKNSYFYNNNQCLRFIHPLQNITTNNVMYNNIFNCTRIVSILSEKSNFKFNTTINCSAGLNILGNSCTGGNYYTNPNGTGFSDTCTDINPNNGVCDSIFNYTYNNVTILDYHPLTKYVQYNPPAESAGGGGSSTSSIYYPIPQPTINNQTANDTIIINKTNNSTKSYSESCDDGILNTLETDIDCGGVCNTCDNSLSCLKDSDCTSSFCFDFKCSSTCFNKIKDVNEEGIDCGGSCAACANNDKENSYEITLISDTNSKTYKYNDKSNNVQIKLEDILKECLDDVCNYKIKIKTQTPHAVNDFSLKTKTKFYANNIELNEGINDITSNIITNIFDIKLTGSNKLKIKNLIIKYHTKQEINNLERITTIAKENCKNYPCRLPITIINNE